MAADRPPHPGWVRETPGPTSALETHLLHSGLLSGKEKERILEWFLFWHQVVTQRNAEKPYNRTVYIHTNYTISSSMQVLCVLRLIWSVIRWSLSDPSLTLRSPANESPACLSLALAPWGLFDCGDCKDSCCLQPGMMSRQRLAACQRSAALCAHCCNPHGSAGGRALVGFCFTDSSGTTGPKTCDVPERGDPRSPALKTHTATEQERTQ